MKKAGAQPGNKNHMSHGQSKRPVYSTWQNLKARCSNPKSISYPNYGGRGIRVLWNSFEEFYIDMGDPPKGMTVERIDNNGHYCKSNCKWATRIEQGVNKRNNRLITFDGQTKPLCDWSRELGINCSTLSMRIDHYKWSLERAFAR